MNFDKTFCASPNCHNECGRKMSDEHKALLKKHANPYVSYAYFCEIPDDPDDIDDCIERD